MNNEKTILDGQITPSSDYNHSANSIFHFMKERRFLIEALDKKCLIPRYCIEDMRYLKIWHRAQNKAFAKIAIPQKCFCDIKLHNINYKVKHEEKMKSHIELYGNYALGFSKAWAEEKGIQPVLYINENSPLAKQIISTISFMLEDTPKDNNNFYENLVAYQLAFVKPIRGDMTHDGVHTSKNFHDEREWRYVPSFEYIPEDYMAIIMEKSCIEDEAVLDTYNKMLKDIENTHLNFEYDDIKYIIVPNEEERDSILKHINETVYNESLLASRLISKLVVLNDILEDW